MLAVLEHATNADQARIVIGLVLMTLGLGFLLAH
jgi:hypothetical protein